MTRRRSLRSRVTMFAVLLAGLGGLAVLTRLSLQANRLQQQTAHSLMAGLASRVADRYATVLQGQLYIGGTALLNRAGLGRMATRTPNDAAAAILAAVPEVARCLCAPSLRPRYAFRANLRDGTLDVRSADSAGSVDAPSLPMLRQELGDRVQLGGWDVAVSSRLAPGGTLLFFTRVPGDPDAIAGFAVDTAEIRYRLIHVVDAQRAVILTESGLEAADSMALALRIELADSTLLASLRPTIPGTISGTSLLPQLFGGWRITAGLTEAVAAHAVGAEVGRSPLILMLVLAGLAAAALLFAGAAARRADDLAATRASLITGVSHELRTPLTEILLVGESIQRGQYRDGPELAGAVDTVVREAHRLLGMLGNVLHLSITGSGATRTGVAQRIGDEVRRVIADFGGIAAGYQCNVTLELHDDEVVAVDLDAVRQILNNLLDNACRYGGPGQSIVVDLRRHGDALRLTVHDQGPGIPRTHREAVWQPFVRGPQPEGRERSGSGIGLAVARQLAESLHGRTGIAEHAGPGAAVYVEFPLVLETP